MWFFSSSEIIFGEDALSWLSGFKGKRAMIVTDQNMVKMCYASRVQDSLAQAGIESRIFADVEPDPCLDTVQRCADAMTEYEPDWIVGLGGGSCMDAAKAAWFMYERPDVELEAINPMQEFGLRAKAHLINIPTTAGSGAEVTAAAVIKDTQAMRKLEMASREIIADYAIIDPSFSAQMPPMLTADTGIDALTHAVEGYSCTWANDFTDGLCLQAARMVFKYLPQAMEPGPEQLAAREKMANAATIAGLGMTNSHIALAHAMGHCLGTIFHLPHGRVTGLCLPYTIEFNTRGEVGRYLDLVNILGMCAEGEAEAGMIFATAVRELMRRIHLPLSLVEAGVSEVEFRTQLEGICERAMMDTSLVTTRRIPTWDELIKLFEYAYEGRRVDF